MEYRHFYFDCVCVRPGT